MADRSFNAEIAELAAAHAIDLLRFDSGARRDVLVFLRRLEVRLTELLRRSELGPDDGPRFVRELRLQSLLDQVQTIIYAEYGHMAAANETTGRALAKWESAETVRPLRSVAIAAEIDLNVLTAEQLRAIASNVLISGAPSRSWWAGQSQDLVERFANEIREGMALGESVDDMVRRVRGRATGKRHVYELNGKRRIFVEFTGGLMDTATRNAEALVRTSVAAVSSDARRETYRANQDVVKGVVQVSTLDSRTTVICLARAGKAWAFPDMQPIGHDIAYAGGVPQHFGCRSVESPILRSWRELGIDLDDAGAGQRWSRLDGKVPGDFTFDDFMKRRTAAQVEQQLGARAAELYRAGKLDLEDLISHATSRPLSVREIEALAEAA